LLGKLPDKEISVMTEEELNGISFKDLDVDGEWGYVFCVDLGYESDRVKERISEFPFPPERRTVKVEAMSSIQLDAVRQACRNFVECERVLLTVYKKYEIVLYYKFLKWMVGKGAVVTRRYYGIKFKMAKLFSSFAAHNVNTRYSSPCELIGKIKKPMNNNFIRRLQVVNSDHPNTKLVSNSIKAVQTMGRDGFINYEIIGEAFALFK